MILFPKMCICGTGSSLNSTQLTGNDQSLIAWGNAMKFFLLNGRYPGTWLFLDAHAIVDNLQFIIDNKIHCNTQLVMTDPINTRNLVTQLKYSGGFDKHPKFQWASNGYKKYLNLVNKASEYINISHLRAISYHSLYGKTVPGTDVKWWTTQLNHYATQGKFMVTAYRDKLLHYILPLVYYVQFVQQLPSVNINLIGFDGGIGGRFDNPKSKPKDGRMIVATKKHLPTWLKIMKTLRVHLYSDVDSKHSIISEVINGH